MCVGWKWGISRFPPGHRRERLSAGPQLVGESALWSDGALVPGKSWCPAFCGVTQLLIVISVGA